MLDRIAVGMHSQPHATLNLATPSADITEPGGSMHARKQACTQSKLTGMHVTMHRKYNTLRQQKCLAYWLRREWLPMEALLVSLRRAARVPPLTVIRPEETHVSMLMQS